MSIRPIGWRFASKYDYYHKRWRLGATIKANPLRGGGAKGCSKACYQGLGDA